MAYLSKNAILTFVITGILVLYVKIYSDIPKKGEINSVVKGPRTIQFNSGDQCELNDHIVFVRTHKTGSTTLLEILYQIRSHSKKFYGIPSIMYGGYPAPFNASMGYSKTGTEYKLSEPGEKFEFIAGHMVFNKDNIKKVVPDDTRYITIIRHPTLQIPSAFNFYYTIRHGRNNIYGCHTSPFYEILNGNRSQTIEKFLELPLKNVNRSVSMYFRARNFQAYDLGLDAMNEDKDYLISKTKELDATFDLVLITEYFDESLVLLKSLLCTTFEKIYYYSKNRRVYEKPEVTPTLMKNMKKFYYQDFYLYDYFNRTLWRKIDEFGREKFERELKEFREFTKQKDETLGGYADNGNIGFKTQISSTSRDHIYPYIYPPEFRYLFDNPNGDEAIETAQRMKFEAFRFGQNIPGLMELYKSIDYNAFGWYVSKYTKMCEVRPD